MKSYRIIDSHCHIYPDRIAEKASASTGEFYHMPSRLDGKLSTLLLRGGRAGIGHFVVQSVATSPHQVAGINRFIAGAVAENPEKLTGLGTLHPDSDSMEGDVEELLRLGLKGVKLHPDIQGVAIDDPRMERIYALCEGRLPILMHTGDSRFDYSNPNRMKPILEKYRDLTVIGAHFGGWSVWEEAAAMLCGYEQFYVDCSSSLYAMPPEKARELIDVYGVDRVLFGTDYPMWEPEAEIDLFMRLPLTEDEREAILARNASRLLSIAY